MAGELDYNDLLYRTHWIFKREPDYLDTDMIPQLFPHSTLHVLGIFILIFPIIIMNLFFGIAVNDVNSIIKFGMVHQNIKMVKIIQIYDKAHVLLLYLIPSPLHKFIKVQPLYKEVRKNVCEVDLSSHGDVKTHHISRHLEKRILMAIDRTQDKGQNLPIQQDIMKMVELNKTIMKMVELNKTMIERLLEHKMEQKQERSVCNKCVASNRGATQAKLE